MSRDTDQAAEAKALVARAINNRPNRCRVTVDIDQALDARIRAAAAKMRPPGSRRDPIRVVVESALAMGVRAVELAIDDLVRRREQEQP